MAPFISPPLVIKGTIWKFIYRNQFLTDSKENWIWISVIQNCLWENFLPISAPGRNTLNYVFLWSGLFCSFWLYSFFTHVISHHSYKNVLVSLTSTNELNKIVCFFVEPALFELWIKIIKTNLLASLLSIKKKELIRISQTMEEYK